MRYVPLALAGFVVLVFCVALFEGVSIAPSTIPSPFIGKPAPAFSMPRLLQSGQVSPDDFKTDNITLLNVWASWCVPCRTEHPHLMALKKRGVRIIGLNYKDNEKAARAFLAARGNPFYKVGVDKQGQTAFAFGVYGVPETFVIDEQGRILTRLVGALDETRLATDINPLLSRQSSRQSEQ
ncbi:MAG: DsbE family thiol:disulfide interchange protein [Alphaproteobacteria bacterium]|nr:DsbE family thiol:disulfide interchange protein [Alphaproteobacteria bacterium]